MRLEPQQRRTVIITAAVRVARDGQLSDVTHGAVAKRCTVKTSAATVRHYFPDRSQLWRAVIDADERFALQGKELGLC